MTEPNLKQLATIIHAENAKWWIDLTTGKPLDRNFGEMCMLMVSEVAEAMEGERKSLPDDKLPHRPMPEVEIADVMIRLMDICGHYEIDCERAKGYVNPFYATNKAENLLYIVRMIVSLEQTHESWASVYSDQADKTYLGKCLERVCCSIASSCMWYCKDNGYDLWGAIEEKRAYNRERADHKAENRIKEGGKKW